MKKSFLLYNDIYENLKGLSIEDKASLLDAIFKYSLGEEIGEMSPVAKMAFGFIKNSMDRDFEKYESICGKRSAAGILGNAKRWGKKKGIAKIANAISESQKSQEVANIADNDSDSVPDSDSVSENEEIKKEIKEKKPIKLYNEKWTLEEVAKKVVEAFNYYLGTKFKDFRSFQGGLEYWLETYTLEDIETAISNVPKTFWKGKMTPVVLFRRKNPQGEPVDYISQLINYSKEGQNGRR